MPVIGTAGHVDHGKSTLVLALTGRDPDRWDLEKERGLTIDLGFAWATLPSGVEVSFVDVPGHERYLKNMLAGIEGIDVGLLVVAADEGWMPQSEEHLSVLDLLEIHKGVVAVTKVDRVDDDLVSLAVAEVEEKLAGTSMDGVPIIPVSATAGSGLNDLRRILDEAVSGQRDESGRPRLWIDRVFPVSGAGTVVTGTLLGGGLGIGDRVELFPSGMSGRIRSIQVHERDAEVAKPGSRVALNLSGIDHNQLRRGEMIGSPGQWELTQRFSAVLRTARSAGDFERRGSYQIHIGSMAQPIRITGLDWPHAVVTLDRPLALSHGDRFIIRDTGRKLVVAGGRVLDPGPAKTSHALRSAERFEVGATPDRVATTLLSIRGSDILKRLTAHSGGGEPSEYVHAGEAVMDPGLVEELRPRVLEITDQSHRDHPLRAGVPLATVATSLGVDASVVEHIVEADPNLTRIGPDVARADREIRLDATQERSWQEAVAELAGSLAVPSESDLGLDAEVLALKVRRGELVRISPGLVYLPQQVEQIQAILADLGEEFTVADFRDRAGLSRKYAVPILEWADKEGLTVRRGDFRSYR